ncbi:MAG: hypothetical protein L0I44_10910, partial [Enterococcus sp.]|nr:hypothetical protein [Enterococcus sp.]
RHLIRCRIFYYQIIFIFDSFTYFLKVIVDHFDNAIYFRFDRIMEILELRFCPHVKFKTDSLHACLY